MTIQKRVVATFITVLLVPYVITGFFLFSTLSGVLGPEEAWSFVRQLFVVGAVLVGVDMVIGLLLAKDLAGNLFSAKEEAERQAKKSEERFRDMFAGTKDGLAILDLSGKITDINEAYIRFSGLSREEIMGDSNSQNVALNKFFGLVEEELKAILDKGEPAEREKEYIRKDGTIFNLHLDIFKIIGPNQEPSGTAVVVKNVTTLKKSGEAVQKDAVRNGAILASLAEPIVAVDVAEKVVFLNLSAERLLGYFTTELTGKLWNDALSFQDEKGNKLDPLNIPIKEAISSKQEAEKKKVLIQKRNGDNLAVDVLISPVVSFGQVTGAALILHEN